MKYSEKKKVEEKIYSHIEQIGKYKTVEEYIGANFEQYCVCGEYDDNSLDLSYYYGMLKEIEADPRFKAKLFFVLTNYIK